MNSLAEDLAEPSDSRLEQAQMARRGREPQRHGASPARPSAPQPRRDWPSPA